MIYKSSNEKFFSAIFAQRSKNKTFKSLSYNLVKAQCSVSPGCIIICKFHKKIPNKYHIFIFLNGSSQLNPESSL